MPVQTHLIVQKVTDLAESVLDDMGYELVDVEYLPKHGKWVLCIYIDKDGGITIDDCVQMSEELGTLIDIKDMIEHDYVLEVSSPGLDRPLKKEKDFIRAVGKRIKVTTVTSINGRRNFTGYLDRFQDQFLHLNVDGKQLVLSEQDIDKANLIYEFNH